MDDPVAAEREDLLLAGRVTGAYGIKGWVRIHSFTDPVANLLAFGKWFARHPGRSAQERRQCPGEISIAEGRAQGKGLIARFDGVNDRDEAEQLRGIELWVPKSCLPALGKNEYYWSDLVGLTVRSCWNEGDYAFGRVKELLETGANDVLVVSPDRESGDTRERLIPYTEQVVRKVDLSSRLILVDWHPED